MTDSPLRVALVHPHSWPEVRRGGERYLDDLATYLASAGHTVDVITGTNGPSARDVEPSGVTFRRLHHYAPAVIDHRGIGRDETFGLRAYPSLLRRKYDVVHAFTPTAAIAARLAGQRTVYTVIGHPTPEFVAEHPAQRRMFATAVRMATVAAALSRASAANTASLLGGGRPVEVLPPGIRVERFPAELAPRTGPPRLLFSAAAGDRRKGVDLALRALPAVLAVLPDARLQLSGAGDHTWALAELGADGERVMGVVDVLGAGTLDDVPARYRAATATVLPSVAEAFGLALVESLASGTPAVCHDDGGMPDIVSDPSVGRVVRSGDVDALATALIETVHLAAQPDTPARCAAHARNWDWDASVGPQHVALYRSLAPR